MNYLKLRIDNKWMEWKPLRGTYKGKTKFICLATQPNKDKYLGRPSMIAGFKKGSTEELVMHLGSLTEYQFFENTEVIKDKELIKKLNARFLIYQKMWEERRLINTAKSLLMS